MADMKKTPAAGPVDQGITDTHAQGRTAARVKAETAAASDTIVLRNPSTGAEQEVSVARWAKEGQTLRQMGFERADALDSKK